MKAYQIKISLKDMHPPVWRRVIIPAGYSFSQLSVILEIAMGWEGLALSSHEFKTLGIEFVEDAENEYYLWSTSEVLEAPEYIIDEYLDQVKSYAFIYDYDDWWEHKVEIEKILDDYGDKCPKVIKYKGDIPVEGCRGVFGYEELKSILADPDDPEYEDMMEWSGGAAEQPYDLEGTNELLSRMYLTNRQTSPKTEDEIWDMVESGKSGLSRIKVMEHKGSSVQKRSFGFPKLADIENMVESALNDAIETFRESLTPTEQALHDLTLMLLYLTRFREVSSSSDRAPKTYDSASLAFLSEEGLIEAGAKGKKTAVFTDKGLEYAKTLLIKYGIKDWD